MIAYFDYAATSYKKPKLVKKAFKNYIQFGVNIGRGKNSNITKCEKIINDTRIQLKKLVKANSNYTCVFQPSATYALNLAIKGLNFENKEIIYYSPFEHNSVMRVLYELEAQNKVIIKPLKTKNYELDITVVEKQFSQNKPNLVIISHVSNVCGKIQDYAKVFELSKKYSATTILDMSQSFGLIETDISNTNVDIAIFAGHKTLYGFSGIGGLILKNSIKLKELIQGGTGILSADKSMPEKIPICYEAGTQNLLGIFSLYYSTTYLLKLGYSNINRIEKKNYLKLKSILEKYSFFNIIKLENSTSIISATIKNLPTENFEELFAQKNIAIRCGLQCSPIAHKSLNTFPSGTLRFSIGLFTTNKEFRTLKRILKHLNTKLSQHL